VTGPTTTPKSLVTNPTDSPATGFPDPSDTVAVATNVETPSATTDPGTTPTTTPAAGSTVNEANHGGAMIAPSSAGDSPSVGADGVMILGDNGAADALSERTGSPTRRNAASAARSTAYVLPREV
jgi:hypothetical protein